VIFGTAALAASIICLTLSAIFTSLVVEQVFALLDDVEDIGFPGGRYDTGGVLDTSTGKVLDAASLLLRLDHHRGDVRHHGDRRQRPHRVFAVLSADH
jgi:hypothetical protein